MIPARKREGFQTFFLFYLEHYLLRKNFGHIYVEGSLDQDNDLPVLYMINHSSWWDGLILFALMKKQSTNDHYVMMDEKGLRAYPFFGKLGAFSVNKENPRDLVKTFRYIEDLFSHKKAVWLFPQGKVKHQEDLPLQFEQGIGRLSDLHKDLIIVPVTFHYYFLEEQKPNVFIKIGAPVNDDYHSLKRKERVKRFQDVLTEQYINQKQAVIDDIHYHKADKFNRLIKPKKSTSDWLDQFKKWVKK